PALALATTASTSTATRATAPRAVKRGLVLGRVLERGTRRPIAGAELAWSSGGVATSTTTDDKGRFTLPPMAPGTFELTVSSYEHERAVVSVIVRAGKRTELVVDLLRPRKQPYEVLVFGKLRGNEPTRFEVDLGEVKVMPGTQGDPLKALQNTPSTRRTPLGLGGLVVRGSPAKDTRVFLDGHELPMLYHFAGLTSVVGLDTLARLDFVPGNFGARYGRATGGIVELESREGKAAPHGFLDIDVFDVDFLAEASVGGGGLLVSGRRTWLDTFFDLTFAGLGDDLVIAPRAYDYQLRYEHPLFGGELSAMILGADDRFEYVVGHRENDTRPRFDLHTGFHRLQVLWSRRFDDGISARLSAVGGLSEDATIVGDAYARERSDVSAQLRADLRWRLSKQLALEGGVDVALGSYDTRRVGPPPLGPDAIVARPSPVPEISSGTFLGDGGETRDNLEVKTSATDLSPALWVEGTIDVGPVRVIPGLRFDHHGVADARTIDPRLVAFYEVTKGTRVKGAVGRYSSPPDPELLAPTFGNPDLEPEHAIHTSVGVDHELPWRLQASVEGYYKKFSKLPVRELEGDLEYSSTGDGSAAGVELMLRRRVHVGLSGWLSYSLSRSEREYRSDRPAQLFGYDQTHVVTLMGSYRTEQDWTFGARVRYATGNPFVPVLGAVGLADDGRWAPIYDDEPSERLPAFVQLDVRIDKEWVFRDVVATAFVDVQNLLNRDNSEGWQYNFDYSERRPFRGLPILPTAGVRIAF
ncbi:TonB-dependent receptor, partial [Myxococcota bacterium]|nr:TonB-dependent receptor [Myxococcota bacterium]